ncbi:MAG: PadR family transcriptional regulator, partial [Lachnospiraceae bacterium]|nr:PadR family transcriptional regulator [Candidatus Equihabitans merdae]
EMIITDEDFYINGKLCACQGGNLVRFVQPVILSLLSVNPTHGYELLKRMEEIRMLEKDPPDASGVYRMLRDMEKKGLVKSEIVHEEGVGLGKKVYSLTEKGLQCKARWTVTLKNYRDDLLEVIDLLQQA